MSIITVMSQCSHSTRAAWAHHLTSQYKGYVITSLWCHSMWALWAHHYDVTVTSQYEGCVSSYCYVTVTSLCVMSSWYLGEASIWCHSDLTVWEHCELITVMSSWYSGRHGVFVFSIVFICIRLHFFGYSCVFSIHKKLWIQVFVLYSNNFEKALYSWILF